VIKTLSDYVELLPKWEHATERVMPEPFLEDVSRHWFWNIAAQKAWEYGIECWLRLGAKGLIADVSACHYRWRGLMDYRHDNRDVLYDSFGYSVMLSILLEKTVYDMHWEQVLRIVKPAEDNEEIINLGWDNYYYDRLGEVAMRMSLNHWRYWRARNAE
jgi:hypothetical protein